MCTMLLLLNPNSVVFDDFEVLVLFAHSIIEGMVDHFIGKVVKQEKPKHFVT